MKKYKGVELPTVYPWMHNKENFDVNLYNTDVIYLSDHMPNDGSLPNIPYEFFLNSYKKLLGDFFNNRKFITDHYIFFEDIPNLEHDLDNFFLLNAARNMTMYFPDWVIDFDIPTEKKLSFSSNKCRPHRILISCILANFFEQEEILYSYNKAENDSLIVKALITDTEISLNSNLFLNPNWYQKDNNIPNQNYGGGGRHVPSAELSLLDLYQIYNHSAITLVTEPTYFEKGCIITEKTLFPMYCGNFILWPGGWKHAEIVKRLELDVFDDILDHSYQYVEHPGLRVFKALQDNMPLIQNITAQKELRSKNRLRFLENLKKLRDSNFLKDKLRRLS